MIKKRSGRPTKILYPPPPRRFFTVMCKDSYAMDPPYEIATYEDREVAREHAKSLVREELENLAVGLRTEPELRMQHLMFAERTWVVGDDFDEFVYANEVLGDLLRRVNTNVVPFRRTGGEDDDDCPAVVDSTEQSQ